MSVNKENDGMENGNNLDISGMLARVNDSERGKNVKFAFSNHGAADPATYNGVTIDTMRQSNDPAFRKITEAQMKAMGGVAYFAPVFEKEHGREINIKNEEDLAAYNRWSLQKAGKHGVEPLKMETVNTLSEENINKFFVENYFDKAGINAVKDNRVQYVLFDMSINFGAGSEKRNNGMAGILKRTLDKDFPEATGNNIFERANNVDGRELIKSLAEERLATYERIIEKNPLKAEFRNGWRNRTKNVTEQALNEEFNVADLGSENTVSRYSKRNKTYGVSGIADGSFFDADSSFWQSILGIVKDLIAAITNLFSDDKKVTMASADSGGREFNTASITPPPSTPSGGKSVISNPRIG
ncbi:MAG: glycosyl hydrolase 108 family protein [Rickettsiales bacterium]